MKGNEGRRLERENRQLRKLLEERVSRSGSKYIALRGPLAAFTTPKEAVEYSLRHMEEVRDGGV
jgi:hypothetical protein